jgi:hypothetical protein
MAMWRARYVMAVGVFLLCFQTHSLLTMRAAQRDDVTAPSVATSSVATSSAPTAATGGAMRMTVLIFPSDVNGKNRAKRLQAIIDTWGAELRDLQKHQLARVVLMLSEQEAELCAPPDRSVVRSQRAAVATPSSDALGPHSDSVRRQVPTRSCGPRDVGARDRPGQSYPECQKAPSCHCH